MTSDAFAGLRDISRAYGDGETTAGETVDALLRRIEVHEPRLGAFQAVYGDDARAAAEAADLAMRNGHRIGPFHGLPFALKDIVDVEGRITTAGSAALRGRVPPATATIARRLLAAGGILVGKTKTVEFAMGGWGTNQHMGTPRNPWDMETARVPGGSSSGSGVAVAAGLVPCAVGTDTGGSVRLPASFCGIVGLKATEGTLPTDGIVPLSHTLDTPGPMTRSVGDAAFMFDVMAGRGGGAGEDPARRGLKGLRMGILAEPDREPVDGAVLALYDAALETFQAMGAELVPFEPPVSFRELGEDSGLIFITEGYAHHRAAAEDPSTPMDEHVRARFLDRRDVAAHEYIAATLRRRERTALFRRRLADLSALLTPTTAAAAAALAEVDETAPAGWFTRPVNYLAMCALSVPMGLTADGLPAGLQIAGPGSGERTVLRIGAAYEGARGPFGRPALPPPE